MSLITKLDKVPVSMTANPDNVNNKSESSREKSSLSTTNKILIGTGSALALAGTVIGGIMYAKNMKFNKALNKIVNNINHEIKCTKNNELFTNKFDLSKIDDEISTVIKQAKKTKQLDELNQIHKQYHIANFSMFKDNTYYSLNTILKESDTPAAKALKKAIEEKGDFVEVRKLYVAEFKNTHLRHNLKHSPANGKNIQETVDLFAEKNLLPKGVKAHTYSSDEMDLALTNYTSGGGYTEYMSRKNHQIEKCSIVTDNYFQPYNTNPQSNISKTLNKNVASFKDPESGVNIVSLSLNNAGGDGINYHIAAGNKSGNLTQLQKDLIDVGARLTEDERKMFATLMQHQENMDYDAILSLIQHYATDANFMARSVQ